MTKYYEYLYKSVGLNVIDCYFNHMFYIRKLNSVICSTSCYSRWRYVTGLYQPSFYSNQFCRTKGTLSPILKALYLFVYILFVFMPSQMLTYISHFPFRLTPCGVISYYEVIRSARALAAFFPLKNNYGPIAVRRGANVCTLATHTKATTVTVSKALFVLQFESM